MPKWRGRYSKFITQYPHEVGAEIGVLMGNNAVLLLKSLPGLKKLYCVDHWQNEDHWQAYSESIKPYKDRTITLRMKSIEASAHIENNSLDFVFIDAGHGYKSVIADIECWSTKVKAGGIVSGHDYIDYKKDNISNPSNYNVKKAVDELLPNANIVGDVWWVINKGEDE